MRRSPIMVIALLLFSPFSVAAEAPLRFSVAESWSMPLIRIENHQPTSGILFDIMQSLARQVGRSAEYHVLPRLRVQPALDRGEVDIRCYTAQAWVPNLSGDYLWSLPILYQRDLLIASAETAAGPYPDQFDHETIGTVLGYNYPTMEHLFDNHKLVREDARSQEHALRKLIAGRYNYAIASQLIMDWINRDLPDHKRLKAVSLISEQPAGCIVRNDPDIPVQKILRTLVRMQVSGEIQQIIDRYTAPRAP
ncbi:amino acid ABC transporter substrate-binding protein [Pseudomonas cichorii]|uniref:Transporter substrate-binding domain-containing protein n=1 Tax=Pseudomonas serbiensis TaxID=3064350 RepID=A0ABT9CYQ8_9PSED|nr:MULTISPECIES: transporter substrate-binding domain-containing protein [Pseudomonas]MDO7930409.1 transporter substrate-binding domain-containing protein [Pseudomonas sp. KFB-138]GFM88995.1 amino acid ABC transporter substrate-binding protein [Pseudomonas cichorii]